MSIGGIDIVLRAPASESIADAILRAIRVHWPLWECVFQDAQEHEWHSFADPWVWLVGTSRKEFSVYRDPAAVESWHAKGAAKDNANTMLHFIIGDETVGGLVEVAMIFDRWTPELRDFVRRLQLNFLAIMTPLPRSEAA